MKATVREELEAALKWAESGLASAEATRERLKAETRENEAARAYAVQKIGDLREALAA